jgi:hypothetical protein
MPELVLVVVLLVEVVVVLLVEPVDVLLVVEPVDVPLVVEPVDVPVVELCDVLLVELCDVLVVELCDVPLLVAPVAPPWPPVPPRTSWRSKTHAAPSAVDASAAPARTIESGCLMGASRTGSARAAQARRPGPPGT